MNLEELKLLQKIIIKKNRIINIIGAIFILLLFIGSYFSLQKAFDIIIIFIILFIELFIGLIIIFIIKRLLIDKSIELFYNEFKNVFVRNNLKKYFTNLNYNPKNGFDYKFVKDIDMIYLGDSFESNDYISGVYKDINFLESDMHIQVERQSKDSDGNVSVSYDTVFLGRLMIFDFNKNFKSNVGIFTDDFYVCSLPYKNTFSKVKMEDEEFNKIFSVYSDNSHDAFYIITPHFMEKLLNVRSKLKCGMMFGFKNSKLFVAIDNRVDSFEYDVFKPIDEKKISKDIEEDIKIIIDFIDDLNLLNDLFK